MMRMLAVAALFAVAGLPAMAEPVQHLFYEVVTAEVPASASFKARLDLTRKAHAALAPEVLRIAGVAPAGAETQVTVGGWKLRTNPSLHTGVAATDEAADRLAAALGFVLRQDSILIADLAEGHGQTGYALVRFPGGTLTPEVAQRFFLHAARVNAGLGGGYTAFGDDMLFLNVRGDGTPYSGLEDRSFVLALGRAAESFQRPRAVVAESGTADARFVENDWTSAPNGETYAQRLDPGWLPALRELRARHAALVRAAGR